MKKLIALSLMVLSCAATAKDAKDDCPSAADAAEAQNPNLYKHCDYSNTGLTLAFKKAFGAGKESAETSDAAEKKPTDATDTKVALAENEFSNSQQLGTVKFNLVVKALKECPAGVVVEAEEYVPSGKVFKLSLKYHCNP